MVLLISKENICLISPDRKQVLLYKEMEIVASATQGHKNADHFGIIIRDTRSCEDTMNTATHSYIGYVFKCQSDFVAEEILTAVTQSLISFAENKKNHIKEIFSCEHCPMLWYHNLCADVDGLNDKKTQTMIFRRIDQLAEEEQEIIMAKYYGAEEIADHSLLEQNQFLLMLLRAHCEYHQQNHIHDGAEQHHSEFLSGSTIFMKAKQSLTNSFDHLLKRKSSKDEASSTQKDANKAKVYGIHKSK